jgi:hypothetical protein
MFLWFILKKLYHQKELEFQQNAQYCEYNAIYGTFWQQWQCHSDHGEISDVEKDLDRLYGETGLFQLYTFSYGTEVLAFGKHSN